MTRLPGLRRLPWLDVSELRDQAKEVDDELADLQAVLAALPDEDEGDDDRPERA